ncbi:MAG TPA: methylenetetrahydrofolate reductase [NAD(P)H] [Marinospirillum sp.]|uniref:methylenetetrahydrofolate reductase [NAD(P)H] n=1 Tax=Marinospirillum sp. TaxID=2183934 RepID=UPI002B47C19F|nr:methylenetetrahydrofolate reductase [NAD(P)H] [Marinospirillum sp.]HKM14639.1 methylenetetrahydrofolate reductase [NAD(P)H] [Marinospirillum sp.]
MPSIPISFEFFPPKTPVGQEKLLVVRNKLAALNPEFFSVTYGAGGSTQDGTLQTVLALRESGIDSAPHMSCIGASRAELRNQLQGYKDKGIRRLVALRGDLPSGMGMGGELRYANELVAFIRQEFGKDFIIEVAAYPESHPQAANLDVDIQNFVRKCQAGADSAITQYFFNADAYFYFVDRVRAKGIEIPIIPGIMPITNYSKLARFSDACGAELPRWIRKQLESYGDDSDSIIKFGEEVISNLCQQLIEGGAPSLHFYTLNQAEASLAVVNNLK